jgi:hypothetical protein
MQAVKYGKSTGGLARDLMRLESVLGQDWSIE